MSTLSSGVDIEEIWEQIDDAAFVAELRERSNNTKVVEAMNALAPDDDDPDPVFDPDPEPMFERMGDWDRAELLKVLREDDGRRCIDVLKRHCATIPI